MRAKFILPLLVLLLVGCSPFSATYPSDTGVEGQVLLGPICPEMQTQSPCPDQPYQATLTILTTFQQRVVQLQTDADGRFHVALPAGEYILHPESPNGRPYAADQTFTVRPGEFTHITVIYDTGIR